jgi:hypothetical protein
MCFRARAAHNAFMERATLPFSAWLVECATRYAQTEDSPDHYDFGESLPQWVSLHDVGLTPAEAVCRVFGTLH